MIWFRGPEATDPFSNWHKLYRLIWSFLWWLLASWTPPPLAPLRRLLLVLFGAKMARASDVRGRATVWYPPNLVMEENTLIAEHAICYNQALVRLRRGAIVSQGARLMAGGHDIDDPEFKHVARPIEIGADAWIAAEAFLGPGVQVGKCAVLGARGVAFGALEPDTIYVGNPARAVRMRGVR